MSFGRFQSDFYISSIVLIVAIAFSTVQFLEFQRFEKPDPKLEGIPVGKSVFAITSYGKCIGWFETEVEYSGHYDLDGEGELRIGMGEDLYHLTLSLQSGFNSLGQMAGGFLILRKGNDEIRFGAREVNPIQLELKGKVSGNEFDFQRTIPGPIEIVEYGNTTVGIRHRTLSNLASGSGKGMNLNPVVQTLGLELVPLREELNCKGEAGNRLVMDPIMGQLQGGLQMLRRFSGEAL